jgi:hypothetical protein
MRMHIGSAGSTVRRPTRSWSESPCTTSSHSKAVTRVAREIRLLEQAMKATNAKTVVEAYDQDDAVLGELT